MITTTPDSLLRRRSRNQTNFPTDAFQLGKSAVYLQSQVPMPEEEFLRYEAQELEIVRDTDSETVVGEQVIMDETSSSRDVAQQLRALREQRRHLYRQQAEERKALRADALTRSRFTVNRWVKQPTGVYRPIYKETLRLITKRIKVEGRRVQVPRTFHRRLPNGAIQAYAMLVWITPTSYKRVGHYVKKRVKVGYKLVTRNKRVLKPVSTVNWAMFRLTFGEALDELNSRYGSQLRSLQVRIEKLRKALAARQGQPNTLKTWTTTGFVPVHRDKSPDPDIPGAWSILPSTVMRIVAFPYKEGKTKEINHLSHTPTGVVYAPNGALWLLQWFAPLKPIVGADVTPLPIIVYGDKGQTNELLADLRRRMAPYEYPFAVQSTYEDALESVTFDTDKALPEPSRIVDMSEGDASLDRNAILNAATRVTSLIKRGDTQFRVLRSLLELKDTPELAQPGRQFLAFLAAVRDGSEKLPPKLRFAKAGKIALTGLQLLAGCYLTKKMAVEPTISDIETCINNSREWIANARRSLTVLLDELKKSETNILHYRVKTTTPGSPRSDVVTVEVKPGPRGEVELKQFVTVDKAYAGEQTLATEVADSNAIRTVETEWIHFARAENEFDFEPFYDPIAKLHAPEPGDFPDLEVLPQNRIGEIHYLTEGRAEGVTIRTASRVDGFLLGEPDSGHPKPDIVPEQKVAALKEVTGAEWPRPLSAVYVMNRVTAVAFARYSVDVVREYSSYLGSGSLTSLVDGLLRMESLEAAAQSIGTVSAIHADEIRILWDLAPLSFVAEWFSTVGDVIDRLNAFAEERVAPSPTSLDGTWATVRCDLLAGMPRIDIESYDAKAQVTSWFVTALRRKFHGAYDDGSGDTYDEMAIAVPRGYTVVYKYTYRQEGGTASLSRTGLYRVIRGAVTPTLGDIITPHVFVRLSNDKLTSLIALLTSFLGGKR